MGTLSTTPGDTQSKLRALLAHLRPSVASGGDAELKALEDEYRGAREEDEEAMVTMRQKSGQERSKGLAVKNQQVGLARNSHDAWSQRHITTHNVHI